MTFKDLNIRLRQLVSGVVDRETMGKVADRAKELVTDRTRKGFGVEAEGAPKTRLKGLSESYKKQRRRLRKQGKLDNSTTPGKSNLTQSGQMLKSLKTRASNGQAEVFLGNEEAKTKAKHQADSGRKFMNLSKTEQREIKKIIETELINDIKKKGL